MKPLRTLIIGFLAFSAIATSADAQQEAAKRRVPAEVLKQFDVNQDGALDKKERRAAHEAIQKRRDLRGDLAKQAPQKNRPDRAQAAPEGNPGPQTRGELRARRSGHVEAAPKARQQTPSRRSLRSHGTEKTTQAPPAKGGKHIHTAKCDCKCHNKADKKAPRADLKAKRTGNKAEKTGHKAAKNGKKAKSGKNAKTVKKAKSGKKAAKASQGNRKSLRKSGRGK
ncbi:MAG: hypothetical protein H8E15_01080 [Planctomycetes bacterium]|nr:hypothetical protein [Planctomycetota bacterium]